MDSVEHFLVVENSSLSSMWIQQQSSLAEHLLVVEDGPLSSLWIQQQSSVAEHFLVTTTVFSLSQ